MIAFEKFKDIQKLDSIVEKQKSWLEDYKGLFYSSAYMEKHMMKWQTEKKKYRVFESGINCIARKKDRIIIEFDDHDEKGEKDKEKIKKNLELTKERLKEKGWGYIESTHMGASNYLWVEFTRELTSSEAEAFLNWIAPEGSEVDTNFCSDEKVFQVLFAVHWRHSSTRELPIDFIEGEKIDYDSLGIIAKKTKGRKRKIIKQDGFQYDTFIKEAEPTIKGIIQGWNSKEDLAERLYSAMPYFYDKARNWWLWNKQDKCWAVVDETEILVMIKKCSTADTINSKERNELLEAMKQIGREKKPKDIKPTWIQFKDNIVDITTGERLKASPEYFVTNPIPWDLDKNNLELTPTMDKIFEEWVGKDNVKTLYEILAYCMIPDYPIHRIFCFVGAGMNGKSKFLELLRRFVGRANCTTSELDVLTTSRFEITRLYKKV